MNEITVGRCLDLGLVKGMMVHGHGTMCLKQDYSFLTSYPSNFNQTISHLPQLSVFGKMKFTRIRSISYQKLASYARNGKQLIRKIVFKQPSIIVIRVERHFSSSQLGFVLCPPLPLFFELIKFTTSISFICIHSTDHHRLNILIL